MPSNGTVPDGGGFCVDLVSPHTARGVALNNVIIGLPSLAFVAFLAAALRPSLRRLSSAGSHMLTAYYAACWGVGGLALARALLLTFGGTHPAATAALDALWLATRAATTTLEVAAVVFLLQGYGASGAAAMARTLAAAGGAAAVDAAVQASLMFGRHVPLFTWGGPGGRAGDLRPAKWGYWLAREAAFAGAYAALAALPHSRHAALLPARPSFFRYAAALAAVHGAVAVGALLLLAFQWRAAYCLAGAGFALFYAAFGPALYAAFLAPFFRDAALDLDAAFYSEMQDAGYEFSDGGGSEFF